MIKNITLTLLVCIVFTAYSGCQNKVLDSVNLLIKKSKDSNFSVEEQLNFALKSSKLAQKTKMDSIVLRANRNLSMRYFLAQDYDNYAAINKTNFGLAIKLKDSSAVTVAGSNLGSFFRYLEKNDSSYYYYSQALKYYQPNEVSEQKATALLYMADVQQLEKIYAGAEEAAIKSIIILNRLPETQSRLDKLWSAYNLMGIISRELGNYTKALEYYDKSSQYAKRINDGFINEVYSSNNKAYVYKQMGHYDKAIELYQNLIALRPKYEAIDSSFFATVMDNIATTQLESGAYDFNLLKSQFIASYNIAEQLDEEVLKMNVALNIAKLYKEVEAKDSIYKYANEALEIAYNVSANEIRQKALLLLADISTGEKARLLLKEHIRISDSLLIAGRDVRNKYARIEFETDRLEEENEKIEAENQKISKENFQLVIFSGVILLLATFIYIVISFRAKNRKLKLIQVQQKANEDIYNLMLSQQDKVDEARTQEKKRISEELHDGVLGRLFGTRLSLDSINFKEGKDAILSRANYISQLKTIEEDIRKISHELNTDFVSGSGFMDIISELIEQQTKVFGLQSNFNYTDDISWDSVSNKLKINIYRIVQESLQNIYKHANAKAIKISISLEKNVICLSIIDDGDGFDTSKNRKGIGLKNMSSRVEDVNGKIQFISKSGQGTIVNVKIPYANQFQ